MANSGIFPRLAALLLCAAAVGCAESLPEVVMYKDPDCGCCGAWAERMEAAGFHVKTVATRDLDAVKQRFAVPPRLEACHTATVAGYVVEGHVPPADVKRLLKERPALAGIAVPGMPAGSPGMETPGRKDPYDVIAFDATGGRAVFASHR